MFCTECSSFSSRGTLRPASCNTQEVKLGTPCVQLHNHTRRHKKIIQATTETSKTHVRVWSMKTSAKTPTTFDIITRHRTRYQQRARWHNIPVSSIELTSSHSETLALATCLIATDLPSRARTPAYTVPKPPRPSTCTHVSSLYGEAETRVLYLYFHR